MLEIRKYLGIPFENHGDTFDGVDCYGLAVLFNRHELAKELPNYKKLYANSRDHDQAAGAFEVGRQDWAIVNDAPKFGDLILYKERGAVTHCGIYLDGRDFLHIREGSTSMIEPLNSIHWASRQENIIRWIS